MDVCESDISCLTDARRSPRFNEIPAHVIVTLGDPRGIWITRRIALTLNGRADRFRLSRRVSRYKISVWFASACVHVRVFIPRAIREILTSANGITRDPRRRSRWGNIIGAITSQCIWWTTRAIPSFYSLHRSEIPFQRGLRGESLIVSLDTDVVEVIPCSGNLQDGISRRYFIAEARKVRPRWINFRVSVLLNYL